MNDFGSQYNAALMMIQKGTNNLAETTLSLKLRVWSTSFYVRGLPRGVIFGADKILLVFWPETTLSLLAISPTASCTRSQLHVAGLIQFNVCLLTARSILSTLGYLNVFSRRLYLTLVSSSICASHSNSLRSSMVSAAPRGQSFS
jgi:hypothetical protein